MKLAEIKICYSQIITLPKKYLISLLGWSLEKLQTLQNNHFFDILTFLVILGGNLL